MAKSGQPKSKPRSSPQTLSSDANDWLQQFSKHFEINLQDHCGKLRPDSEVTQYRSAAILAIFQTLVDSGESPELILESFAEAAILRQHPSGEWNDDLNARRFELIDNEIQGRLTVAESIELAGLTLIMRKHIDSDLDLSIEAAQKLHNKLLARRGPKKR